jgi:hypothetical protein
MAQLFEVTEHTVSVYRQGYKLSIRLPVLSEFKYGGKNEETPHIEIKCDPYEDARNFIAFQFKGLPYGKSKWFVCMLWMEQVFGTELLEYYFNHFRITHAHIAFGMDIKLADVLFNKLWGQKAGVYYSKEGQLETIYLQPNNKNLEIAIYDRKSKMKNRNLKKEALENTRVEFRLGRLNLDFKKIQQEDIISKPFNMIKMYDFQAVKESDRHSQDTLTALSVMGLLPYFRTLSKYRREVFKKNIKEYLTPICTEKELSKLWRSEIKRVTKLIPFKTYKKSTTPDHLRGIFNSTYFND